jgi:two-component system, chemotaxis family, CheB/CheR fusion protein
MRHATKSAGRDLGPATDGGHERPDERAREGIQRLIDALDANVAILEPDGTIDMVNTAWTRFAQENGAPADAPTQPGSNYFSACRPDDVVDGDFAQRAVDGIRGVLDGRLPVFSMEYPCHSPGIERWFVVVVAPFERSRAMVTHVDVTALAAA